jgi:hypothetical protein
MLRGTVDMALGMYFTPSSFTTARYDDTIKRLEEAGAGSPAVLAAAFVTSVAFASRPHGNPDEAHRDIT